MILKLLVILERRKSTSFIDRKKIDEASRLLSIFGFTQQVDEPTRLLGGWLDVIIQTVEFQTPQLNFQIISDFGHLTCKVSFLREQFIAVYVP